MAETRESEGRWQVRERKGSPRGDLYELEIKTYFDVIDRLSGEVVHTAIGLYEASYDGADWSDAEVSGAVRVEIADDDRTALVHHADGRIETVALPVGRADG